MKELDEVTQVRIALLDNYSSQSITHGTYVIGLSVLFFTWIQVLGSIGNSLSTHIGGGMLSSLILTAIAYEGMRTLYWGYLSNTIVGLGYHLKDGQIDFEGWMKEDWLDESSKDALKAASMRDDLLLKVQEAASPNLAREGNLVFKFLRWTHKKRHRLSVIFLMMFVGITMVFLFF